MILRYSFAPGGSVVATLARAWDLLLINAHALASVATSVSIVNYGFTSRNWKQTGAPSSYFVPVGVNAPVAWSILN